MVRRFVAPSDRLHALVFCLGQQGALRNPGIDVPLPGADRDLWAFDVAVHPAGTPVLVVMYDPPLATGTGDLVVLDYESGQLVVKDILRDIGKSPVDVVFSPDGTRAYVRNNPVFGASTIVELQIGPNGAVTRTGRIFTVTGINGYIGPQTIAVSQDNKLYVADQ